MRLSARRLARGRRLLLRELRYCARWRQGREPAPDPRAALVRAAPGHGGSHGRSRHRLCEGRPPQPRACRRQAEVLGHGPFHGQSVRDARLLVEVPPPRAHEPARVRQPSTSPDLPGSARSSGQRVNAFRPATSQPTSITTHSTRDIQTLPYPPPLSRFTNSGCIAVMNVKPGRKVPHFRRSKSVPPPNGIVAPAQRSP